MKANRSERQILAFPIIKAATNGDVDAIHTVLSHYGGYITALSTKRLCDAKGNSYLCVDENMRRRLETKLITKILTFKIV